MYNSNSPSHEELPSSKQLFISTAIALLVALILLITTILPAEYGVDPTGIGRALGLTQMGEIKQQLAEEAELDAQKDATAVVVIKEPPAIADTPKPETIQQPIPAADTPVIPELETYSVTLKPGAAAEVKLDMDKGAQVNFVWSVDQGHVNFDTHADNSKVKYFGYSKGKAVTGDEGILTAEFDGSHGWFWRNRSQEIVTVTLEVSGDYSALKRVL